MDVCAPLRTHGNQGTPYRSWRSLPTMRGLRTELRAAWWQAPLSAKPIHRPQSDHSNDQPHQSTIHKDATSQLVTFYSTPSLRPYFLVSGFLGGKLTTSIRASRPVLRAVCWRHTLACCPCCSPKPDASCVPTLNELSDLALSQQHRPQDGLLAACCSDLCLLAHLGQETPWLFQLASHGFALSSPPTLPQLLLGLTQFSEWNPPGLARARPDPEDTQEQQLGSRV